MAKCRECEKSFGIFELSNGVCKECNRKLNPVCNKCEKTFTQDQLINGYCKDCTLILENERALESESKLRKTRLDDFNTLSDQEVKNIILTTESHTSFDIIERIDIVTAECVYGINVFQDFFTNVRDVIGGRSETTQKLLRQARKEVLNELRKEAYLVNANAVVAVNLNYNEFSGGGKSMLFIVASGTAVRIKK